MTSCGLCYAIIHTAESRIRIVEKSLTLGNTKLQLLWTGGLVFRVACGLFGMAASVKARWHHMLVAKMQSWQKTDLQRFYLLQIIQPGRA